MENQGPPLQSVPVQNQVPKRPEEHEAPRHDKRHWLDYAAIALASIALVVSAVTAGITGYQAWITRDTEQRQLRAYMSATEFKTINYIDPITRMPRGSTVIPVFENDGVTPAVNVKCWLDKRSTDKEFGKANIVATESADRGAHQSIYCSPITLTIDDLLGIWKNQKQVFIWARVEYQDVFKNTPVRFVEACMRIELLADPTTPIPLGDNPQMVQTKVASPGCNITSEQEERNK